MIRWTLLGIVLVDIPALLAVAILGSVYGFRDVASGYLEWREAHPWTLVGSLGLVAGFVVWRRRVHNPRPPKGASCQP